MTRPSDPVMMRTVMASVRQTGSRSLLCLMSCVYVCVGGGMCVMCWAGRGSHHPAQAAHGQDPASVAPGLIRRPGLATPDITQPAHTHHPALIILSHSFDWMVVVVVVDPGDSVLSVVFILPGVRV